MAHSVLSLDRRSQRKLFKTHELKTTTNNFITLIALWALLEVQQGRQKAVEEVPTGRQQPSTTEGWKGKTKADTAV